MAPMASVAALRRRPRGPSGRSRRASPCSAPVDPPARSSGSDRQRLRRVRHRPRRAGAGLGGGGGDGGRRSTCDRRGSGAGGGAVHAGPPRSAARAAAGGRRERAGADARYILLVNATGRDHPRRAGLALHLGAVLDLITVGVTDHPLVATAQEPGPEEGATAPLSIDGEIVGVVLRTRRHVRPVVVHPGWRTDPETARLIVEQCTAKARSPEPLRVARFLARTQRARDQGRFVGPPQPIDTVLRPK